MESTIAIVGSSTKKENLTDNLFIPDKKFATYRGWRHENTWKSGALNSN